MHRKELCVTLVIYQESFKMKLILLFRSPVSHRPKQYWIFVSTVQYSTVQYNFAADNLL